MNDVRQRVHPLLISRYSNSFKCMRPSTSRFSGEFSNILNTPNFSGPQYVPRIIELRYRDTYTGKRSAADAVDGAPSTSEFFQWLDMRLTSRRSRIRQSLFEI